MTGVGGATILLSLLLVRILMVKRLSRLTRQLLSMRHDQLTGRRLRVDHGPLGPRDEISVLAEEFDALLDELSATTRQLTDVSYRARSEARRVGKEWVRTCTSRWSPSH